MDVPSRSDAERKEQFSSGEEKRNDEINPFLRDVEVASFIAHRELSVWDMRIHELEIAAQLSSIGIFWKALQHIFPALSGVGGKVVPVLAMLADMFIYSFRAIRRLVFIVGRWKYGVVFDGEKNDVIYCPNRTAWDIAMLVLFVSAAVLFAVATPWTIFIGWGAGMLGCVLMFYTNYYLKAKASWDLFTTAKFQKGYRKQAILRATYSADRNAAILYLVTLSLIALTVLLGSLAAVFPAASIGLLLAAKIGSYGLIAVNVMRFLNFLKSDGAIMAKHYFPTLFGGTTGPAQMRTPDYMPFYPMILEEDALLLTKGGLANDGGGPRQRG